MKQEFCKFTVESLSASYIPFPRFLMEDCFAELTNDAKVLYALMLDRASISKVNGYTEEDGTIRSFDKKEVSLVHAIDEDDFTPDESEDAAEND